MYTSLKWLGIRLSLICVFLSCEQREKNIFLEISVNDVEKKPLIDATAYINGQKIGVSNRLGIIKTQVNVDLETEKFLLEIKKDSSDFYFAPFIENFGSNDESIKKVVSATLYAVPKNLPKHKVATEATIKTIPSDKEVNDKAQNDIGANTASNLEATSKEVTEEDIELLPTAASPEEESQKNPKVDPGKDAFKDGYSPQMKQLANIIGFLFNPAQEVNLDILPESSTQLIENSKGPMVSAHFFDGDTPIADAELFLGEPTAKTTLCHSNARGRCIVFLDDSLLGKNISLFAQAKNFPLQVYQIPAVELRQNIYFKFSAEPRTELWVYEKDLWGEAPLSNVQVLSGNELVGSTDQAGHLTLENKKSKGNNLTLIAKDQRLIIKPSEMSTNSTTIRKYFLTNNKEKVSFYLTEPMVVGDQSLKTIKDITRDSKTVFELAKSILATKKLLEETSRTTVRNYLNTKNLNTLDLIASGWSRNELALDALIVPTLIIGKEPALSIKIVNHKGLTLAHSLTLKTLLDKSDFAESMIKSAITNTISLFPQIAQVKTIAGEKLSIDIGDNCDNLLLAGEEVLVMDDLSTFNVIAKSVIAKVSGESSLINIPPTLGKQIGPTPQFVMLRPLPLMSQDSLNKSYGLKVQSIDEQNHANGLVTSVFLGTRWIGDTNRQGAIKIAKDSPKAPQENLIRLLKLGFSYLKQSISWQEAQTETITMPKGPTGLRIATEPTGVPFTINGTEKGKSFFVGLLPYKTDQLKINFSPVGDLAPLEKIFNLESGFIINATGKDKIVFSPNFSEQATESIKKNDFKNAISLLEKTKPSSPDYLASLNRIAQIYLLHLGNYDQAYQTAKKLEWALRKKPQMLPQFRNFEININMLKTLAALSLLQNQPQKSRELLSQSFNSLTKLKPQVANAKLTGEDTLAWHGIHYFSALTLQFIYDLDQKEYHRKKIVELWKSYFSQVKDFSLANQQNDEELQKFAKQKIGSDATLKAAIF